MVQPALCGRCGAPVQNGAGSCGFCGVAFVGAPQGAGAPPAASAADQEVLAALRAGNKIDAIRIHRQRHNTSLREAKDAVEHLEARFGIKIG